MILVTGGAGYIGSHVNKLLWKSGYDTVVFDNLVYGHKEAVTHGTLEIGDLADKPAIDAIFEKYPIDTVFHFAAYAYVGESVLDPAKYYRNNVANTLNLLDSMREHGVKRIIFSSTCATYGIPEKVPITEDMPQHPVNPYGATKLMIELILADYHRAYGLDYCCLRYFNAAGADPDGELGESHSPETHLIPLVLAAAAGELKELKVYGNDYPTRDGSCIRDYIHVTDLATAHVKAMDYLRGGGESICLNLGNGRGDSVLEIIEAAGRVTGRSIPSVVSDRRPGDPPVLTGSSKRAEEVLGWKAEYADIETILTHAWNWSQNRRY